MENPHRAMKSGDLAITEDWGRVGVRRKRRREEEGRGVGGNGGGGWEWGEDIMGTESHSGASKHR